MTSICSTSLLLLSAVTLTAFTSDGHHFTLVITGEVEIIAVKAYDQFVRIEEW